MGLLKSKEERKAIYKETYENMGKEAYEKLKFHLADKDGKTHVALITSSSKFVNSEFDCDDKYTDRIESVLYLMQEDGYEIIDIKFSATDTDTALYEKYHTLITYR